MPGHCHLGCGGDDGEGEIELNYIAPIETIWDGNRFRSRTEAKWAVFFKYAGLSYEYEKQGYHLKWQDHEHFYLPDFWLPQLDTWIEIKGNLDLITNDDIDKAFLLSFLSKKDLLLIGGQPSADVDGRDQILWFRIDNRRKVPVPYGDSTNTNCLYVRFTNTIGCDGDLPRKLGLVHDGLKPCKVWDHVSEEIDWIYKKAAYARFEHGEAP